jgi:hypothetical protein
MVMRSLEVHYFETERDLSLALNSGLVLPEQLARTECAECKDKLCYSDVCSEFTPLVLIVDENDQDWIICDECASPMLDYVDVFFPPVVASHFDDPDELEYFK